MKSIFKKYKEMYFGKTMIRILFTIGHKTVNGILDHRLEDEEYKSTRSQSAQKTL